MSAILEVLHKNHPRDGPGRGGSPIALVNYKSDYYFYRLPLHSMDISIDFYPSPTLSFAITQQEYPKGVNKRTGNSFRVVIEIGHPSIPNHLRTIANYILLGNSAKLFVIYLSVAMDLSLLLLTFLGFYPQA